MTDSKIIPVPVRLIPEMWRHVAPHLLKGLTKATDMTLQSLIDDLIEGDDQLWAIFTDKRVVGAFVTAQFIDDDTGKTFLGVYALGGEGLEHWAALLGDTMAEHARLTGASSVRFTGRDAWSRVLPTYRITGRRDNGEAIFERAVQ